MQNSSYLQTTQIDSQKPELIQAIFRDAMSSDLKSLL